MPRTALILAALLAVGVVVVAGPLDPPLGPVSSTYKTLQEVQPRTAVQSLPGSAGAVHVISAPGSYYLTGPISGAAGKAGIEIAASDVWLDLSGFTMTGVAKATDGMGASGERKNITIENGSIRGWTGIGVNLAGIRGCVIRSVSVAQCESAFLTGAATVIDRCTAEANSIGGFLTAEACRLTGCIADGNGSYGFYLSGGATAESCAALSNGGHGYYLDGDGCTVFRSTARSNSLGGITAIYTCTLDSCTSETNAGAGFAVLAGSTIRGCTAQGNDQGGIAAGDGTVVASCTVRGNSHFGIRAGNRCRVEGNMCSEQRAPVGLGCGILAPGIGSRIDGNTLTDNDVGLVVTGTGNLITRNSASGNTAAYSLSAGQTAGPIISGPGMLNEASPWANFEH